MKILMFVLPFISLEVSAMSCNTIEKSQITICNDYPNSGNVSEYKKLCLLPNSMGSTQYIKAEFNREDCPKAKVVAKCELKKKGVTTYYYESLDNTRDEMEKGCKFFKDAVFTNYSASNAVKKSAPPTASDIQNNPVFKKYMDCAKNAKSAEDINKCKSLLKFN